MYNHVETIIPSWIVVMQALFTPVIGLIALGIAWQQWRIAHNKFRLDYFNRRYPIYEAFMQLAFYISENGSIGDDQLRKFAQSTRGIEFYFNPEINKHCKKLYQEALNIKGGLNKISMTSSHSEKEKSQELVQERIHWFIKQTDEIPKIFKPYLTIKG